MMSSMVVKLAGIYCCEKCHNFVVLKRLNGDEQVSKVQIHVNDRHTAQGVHILVCRLRLGGEDLQIHCCM